MKIANKKIVFIAQYAAMYEGNFLKSLYALEDKLKDKGCEVLYILPNKAQERPWFCNASVSHKFLLVHDNPKKATIQLKRIFQEVQPNIVHTHFDGYDVPVVKVLRKLGMEKNVEVVWHLHDHLGFMPDIARKAYQVFGFLMHYGRYAKNVSAIGVSAEVAYFTNTWHKLWNGCSFKQLAVVPNAIDTTRISTIKENSTAGHSFLAFGGRNIQKRIDLLIDAAVKLNGGGKTSLDLVSVYITRGTDTDNVVAELFGKNVPSWCHIVDQRENINELFEMADCFVSSSDAETFSYAICEATIANMPVIQSDIDGTMWNAENPSTFLFKQGDSDSLAEAMMNYVKSNPKDIQQACLETRQNNLGRYGLDAWCERIIRFYEQL